MELWDGYRRNGTLAHVDLMRGEPVPEGLYHLVCEIIVEHQDGSILAMQRDPNKPNHPGAWETTAGGSALKGENALTCAKRELYEETGILASELTLLGREVSDPAHSIFYMYRAELAGEKTGIILQPGETVDYRWIPPEEFPEFVAHDMIPSQRRRYHAFLLERGYV